MELKRPLVNQADEVFTGAHRSLLIPLGQEDHELITGVTDRQVLLPRRFFDEIGQMDERLISGIMSVGVIDVLEMIQVQHDQGDGILIQSIPSYVLLEIVVEESAVVEPGQLVLEDQAGRVFADMLKIIGKIFKIHRLDPANRPPAYSYFPYSI
jgi:hypothetical protein